jgi:AcrR family transcriptional regulator
VVQEKILIGRSKSAQEERRRRILQSAIDLFEHQGFLGTSADEIAASAGITKRTLYRYIGSKDRLLSEIHANFVQDGLTAWQEALGQGGNATETLRRLVAAHIRIVADHQAAIRVHFEEWKYLTGSNREQIVNQRDAYEKILRDTVTAGVEKGEFLSIDVTLTTRLILGMLNDTYRWYHPGIGMTAGELADFMATLVLDGLRPSVAT